MAPKRRRDVEITSKKVKRDKVLKKKMKHYKKNHIANEVVGELISQNVVSRLKVKGSKKNIVKEECSLETNSVRALDDFFKSIDIMEDQSNDVDTLGESFCEPSSLEHSSCNISSGPMILSADLNLTEVKKHKVVKASGSSVNREIVANTFNKMEKFVKFHSVSNNQKLIVMTHPTSLYFQGQLSIRVVTGSLEVLGYVLKSDMPNSIEVYSPGGSSLLCLTTAENQNMLCGTGEDTLIELGMDPQFAKSIASNLKRNDCLVIVEKVDSKLTSYLGSQCSIYLYPRVLSKSRPFFEEENSLHCQFETDVRNVSKVYTKLPEWDGMADIIIDTARNSNGPTRVMICGGKAVGKSTLLRFLINKALSQFDEVLCLDFDPGQSEFTVPGCVSVVRVRDPLLGPNFTHMLVPERMVYVGDVDISKCPNRYMKCCQHILDYCNFRKQFKNQIWFINTMGYCKGLGVDLTTALIHMTRPTSLIQIESRSSKRNFPGHLTSTYALNSHSQWCRAVKTNKLDYSHYVLQSAAEEKTKKGDQADWGMQPKTARDVMVLSYISQMLEPPGFSLTDTLPVKSTLARLSLCICHETLSYDQYLSAMNANLVALCTTYDRGILHPSDSTMPTILPTPPIVPCLGFGIIRGIDMTERSVYIITPVPMEVLKTVNCLMLGAVMLPACIYTKRSSGLGHIPYATVGPGQATSKGISKRFFQPLKQQVPLL